MFILYNVYIFYFDSFSFTNHDHIDLKLFNFFHVQNKKMFCCCKYKTTKGRLYFIFFLFLHMVLTPLSQFSNYNSLNVCFGVLVYV